MLWTLAFGSAVSFVAAAMYAFVGGRFARRGDAEERGASRAFAAWWIGIAAYTALQGAADLAGALGVLSLPFFATVRYATLVLICAAFSGLAGYVLFVRTGRASWVGVSRVYYALVALAFVGLVAVSRPSTVVIQRWRTDVTLASAPSVALFGGALLLAVGPAIAACVLYLTIPRAALDEAQRRRVLVVGWGMVTMLVAMAFSRAINDDAVQLVLRPILGAGVAYVIARQFWSPPRPLEADARVEALHRRIRDLV